jgi:hypothetical protein
MKESEEDKIHDLAIELDEIVGVATRAGLKKYPNSKDESDARGLKLREAVIDELEWRLLEVAADLFELAGDRDAAHEVRGTIAATMNATEDARNATRVCDGCGCTDALACPNGCQWVGDHLCSRCAGKKKPQAAAARAPRGRR